MVRSACGPDKASPIGALGGTSERCPQMCVLPAAQCPPTYLCCTYTRTPRCTCRASCRRSPKPVGAAPPRWLRCTCQGRQPHPKAAAAAAAPAPAAAAPAAKGRCSLRAPPLTCCMSLTTRQRTPWSGCCGGTSAAWSTAGRRWWWTLRGGGGCTCQAPSTRSTTVRRGAVRCSLCVRLGLDAPVCQCVPWACGRRSIGKGGGRWEFAGRLEVHHQAGGRDESVVLAEGRGAVAM